MLTPAFCRISSSIISALALVSSLTLFMSFKASAIPAQLQAAKQMAQQAVLQAVQRVAFPRKCKTRKTQLKNGVTTRRWVCDRQTYPIATVKTK